jgi:hypothetical protein
MFMSRSIRFAVGLLIACSSASALAEPIENCATEADAKNMAGEERKTFVVECLKRGVPNAPARAPGAPFIQDDRFEGTTKIISGAPLKEDQPGLQFLAVLKGKRITELDLGVNSHTEGWRYIKCRSMRFLVDGKPLPLPAADWDGDVGYAGYVNEYFWMHVSMATYRRLVKAELIEYKICNDEMAVSEEGMENLRGFVSTVEARTK